MTEQVLLLLERDHEPITGSVGLPGEAPQPFSGWLELIGVLEAWRRGSKTQDGMPTLSTEEQ